MQAFADPASTSARRGQETVRTQERWLDTKDGVRLGLEYLEPARVTGAAILVSPAMGAPARAYRQLGRSLADKGHAVLLLDPRGSGRSELRPSRTVDFGVDEYLRYDWSAAVGWLRQQHPDRKTVLLGHSLGGQLNSTYAGLEPSHVDALVNVCAVWIHFRTLGSFVSQVGGLTFFVLMRVLAEVLGYAPGDKLGWGARFSRQHIRDWSSWGIRGRYDYKGGDARASLAQVTQPTLAVSFSDDHRLGPKTACDRFCEALSSAPITRWH
ncbi:MAG: alpha/beta fold hydrolase, partial [Myxococcota bacterium]